MANVESISTRAWDRPSAARAPEPDPRIAVLERELTESRENAAAVTQVLEALAGARDVGEAIRAVLESVRSAFGWRYATYWARRGDDLAFFTDAGHVNDEFRRATVVATFARGVGLPGRAFAERKLQYVEDVTLLSGFKRAVAAQSVGIKTAIAFPVVLGNEVVGVLDFFVVGTVVLSETRLAALAQVSEAVSRGLQRISEAEAEAKARVRAQVERMLVVVDAASQGDLRARLGATEDDDVGRIGLGLDALLEDFRQRVVGITSEARGVEAAVGELAKTSAAVKARAGASATRARTVAAASTNIAATMQSVSASSEQLSAAISEISRSVNDAARTAASAGRIAEETGHTMAELGESSREIGQVVKLITGIAQQTNLLALNATIEAARAGDAGKGFAVVAHEVKELAKAAARATDDIANRVDAIQRSSTRSSEALTRIATVVHTIEELSTSVAAAVEEQTAATREISRHVVAGAESAEQISREVADVATDASLTTEGAEKVDASAADLAARARALDALVGRFRT